MRGMSGDFLQKFLFEHFPLKGSLVRLSSSWQEVCSRASPPEFARDLLGEAISASVLLTSNIKFRGSVSLQIQSAGPVQLLLGQCTDRHEVRGVVRVAPDPSDNETAKPVLSINLEPEDGGAPYQGIVELGESGLASALQDYFTLSEQLDTQFFLHTGRNECAGLMIQRMPGEMRDPDAWNRIIGLASTVSNEELLELETKELLHLLFREEDVRLFRPGTVAFGCSCSTASVAKMLKTLGETETTLIVEERGSVDVRCEYCGTSYRFDSVDIAQLFTDGMHASSDSSGLH